MYIILLFQQLIASSTHLFAKSVTSELHPAVVVLLRGVFSVAAYGLWSIVQRKKLKPFEMRDLPLLLILGAINIPINQLMFIWGVSYTTAPNAALAYALSPAFVLIIATSFFGEKITKWKIIGIVIAIIGTVLVLLEKGLEFNSKHFWGNIMVLGASCSWAFYTILGKRFAQKYGALQATALCMMMGFVLYVPVFGMLPIPMNLGSVSSENWWKLLYLGGVTSTAGYALWYYALTKGDASKVSVFNNLQPVFTTVLALIFMGTQPTPLFIVGGLIAITGVIITQRG